VPGEYCFPPIASLITSGARLMLGLLEHAVTTRGGTYAMEDTDSMAIVATESGGLVACLGGSLRLPDGREAIKALTWSDVGEIVDEFRSLNPYDRTVVPGSILKIEDDNFNPETKRQRQLYCFAISSKRYALFVRDSKGQPTLTKWSEHGLGHLCNPTDLDSDDRRWIPQVWLNIVRRALGLRTRPLPFEQRPAIGRVTISGPAIMRPLATLNEGRPYGKQLKPFNFLLTCHVRAFGHPSGADPDRFHLIAPYESDPERWTDLEWIDQYTTLSRICNQQLSMFRVWTSTSTSRVNQDYGRFAGIALPRFEGNLFQRRHHCCLPIVTTGIRILRVSVTRTNQTGLNVLQLV
jgi:hypothetical protein